MGVAAFAVHHIVVNQRKAFASAGTLFLAWQLLFWIGTANAVELSNSTDLLWFGMVSGGLLAFALGEALANLTKSFRPAEELTAFTKAPIQYDLGTPASSLAIGIGVAASSAVGALYATAVGYNVFFGSLKSFLTLGALDPLAYNTERTSVSVGTYVASGYAAQFFAILMPALLCVFYFQTTVEGSRQKRVLLIGLCFADFFFMTVSGGRTWLLVAILGFLALVSPFGPMPLFWPRYKKLAASILVFAIVYYGLSASLMGRSGNVSGVAAVTEGVSEFYERTMGYEAEAHVELMEYFLNQKPQMGAQWWRDLKSIVPGIGNKWETSGMEMYALLHNGDSAGSMGLTFWGSLIYNWGEAIAIALALATGFLFQLFTITYVRSPRTLTRVVLLFLAGTRLIMLRDPYSLLLSGFVTIVGFFIIFGALDRVLRRRPRMAPMPAQWNYRTVLAAIERSQELKARTQAVASTGSSSR